MSIATTIDYFFSSWTVVFPCTTNMLAEVTTASADTLSPVPSPKESSQQLRELCLSEHPWNRLRALTLTELAFKVVDPQTFTPFYQSFSASHPPSHCWGTFAPQPGKGRCCLPAIVPHLYGTTSPGRGLPLSMPHTGVQKLMCPYFAFAELQFWAIILICVFTLLGFILLLLLCFLVSGPFAVLPLTWLRRCSAAWGPAGGTFRHIHKKPSGSSTWHAWSCQILLHLLLTLARTCAQEDGEGYLVS